jgi:C4-dicarboxylate transporter DctQ subunit
LAFNLVIQMFNRMLSRVEDVLAALAAALLLVSVLMVTTDVVSRYFFNKPLAWVFEVTEYFLLFVPCLGMAWLARQDGHVMIDIVTAQLRSAARNALTRVINTVVSGVCFFIAWWGVIATAESWRAKVQIEGILQTPQYLVYGAIPLGFFLCGMEYARKALAPGAR